MRLIDADKLNRKKKYSFQTEFGCFPKNEWFIKLDNLFSAPTIDPIHVAGGCYCKECQYYEPLRDYPDCSKKLTYGYCYCWDYEQGESPNEVDENDFCSKGVITNA